MSVCLSLENAAIDFPALIARRREREVEREGLEDVGEGGFYGLNFSLTKKHFSFTLPLAFALLN